MMLISHRGNINGKKPELENQPKYILKGVLEGYFVEVDVWNKDGLLWLGHDEPQYSPGHEWLGKLKTKLIFHAKNYQAIELLQKLKFHWFWHDQDDYTLTSEGYIWAYPDKPSPGYKSIAVLPEIYNTNTNNFYGICSDLIGNYK
tara:strand:- start:6574 stop:7008 length:435 start_codon:yes stop_codon:yes gene_type:complete